MATADATTHARTDAVVVGAGMSGLVAAHRLQQANHTVAVLEARPRVGGRLLSHTLRDGSALDLGATWFWANEPRVNQLIADLGIAVHDQHLAGDALYHDPRGTQRIDGNPLDVASGRFVGGSQSLATALTSQLAAGTIALSQRVTQVEATPNELIVTTDAAAWIAGHVVLALPPSLVIEHIGFRPELPEPARQLAAHTPVWMGAIAKFVIVFDRAFWRDAGLAGAAISHVGPLREIHDMSGPAGSPAALFGFAPLRTNEATPTAHAVTAQLRDLFGAEMPAPIEIVVADWRAEQFTSPPGVEAQTNYSTYGHPRFAEPLADGRLHWASTETATEAPGHIEGAIAGGERAAAAIIAALGR